MSTWNDLLLLPSATIREAIELIDATSMQVALVVDENRRLLGTVTDGDIRRGLLKGIPLHEPIGRVMNSVPTVAKPGDTRQKIVLLMRNKHLRSIPIVDASGCLIGLETIDTIAPFCSYDNPVILMAGGLGSRLRPLTNECPKPLLNVGGRPILETILASFIEHGFRQFYFAVNYKAEMIQAHFGDGSRWNVEIRYLHEEERLGTAGALGLLPERPQQPLLIMNGDLLTKVNFQQLLDFHLDQQAQATVCVREYNFQVPFGVMKLHENRLIDIEEKPMERFMVNAGIYVLNPEILQLILPGQPLDMPDLLKQVAMSDSVHAFPIREYWLDIGRVDDFVRANGEFQEVF